MDERDGFVISEMASGKEIDFIPCSYNGDTMRDRVLSGILRNMDTDRFLVGDTRWSAD